jgi:DNA-binding IclR family transcriptional regulator
MIYAVAKALKILQLFSVDEPRLSLTEISRRLGMPKSTVHNLLATLQEYGYIERTDDELYAIGVAPLLLTQTMRISVELRDPAAPILRQLAEATRESVYLTIRQEDAALYIYAVESSHRLLARTAVGDRAPLHCTSVGKAMLAGLPEEEVDAILRRAGLPSFTSRTLTDVEALKAELAATRRRGYAIDCGEHEEGLFCIGAAIRDGRGRVIGACSVSGVDPAILGERRESPAELVIDAAQNISRLMGYVPATFSDVVRRRM